MNAPRHQKYSRGFALILSLVVLALLSALALSMLVFSRTQTQRASQADYQSIARANARLALNLAIAQLQQLAGPDQRVTARADITERTGTTLNPARRFLTGVWTTENWNAEAPAVNHRTTNFLGWLASGSNPQELNNLVYPTQNPSNVSLITLVGNGSVSSQNQQVQVEAVPVTQAQGTNSSVTGKMAYAVFDDGIKASFSYAKEDGQGVTDPARLEKIKLTRGSVAPRHALEMIDPTVFSRVRESSSNQPIVSDLSRQSLSISFNQSITDIRPYFHDITPLSIAMPINVREGGHQMDLSSAFELPLNEFNALNEFHASNHQHTTGFYNTLSTAYNRPEFYHQAASPKIGYLYVARDTRPGSNVLVGPSWDLLRNFYRIYKKDFEQMNWNRKVNLAANNSAYEARGVMPLSYSTQLNAASTTTNSGLFSLHNNLGTHYTKAAAGGWAQASSIGYLWGSPIVDRLLPARAQKVSPTVIRLVIAVGFSKERVNGKDELTLEFVPYFTIYNPYNTPISFDSIGMYIAKFNAIIAEVTCIRDGQTTETTTSLSRLLSENVLSRGTLVFRLSPNPNGAPYVLQPGEVKSVCPRFGGVTYNRSGVNVYAGQFTYEQGLSLFYKTGIVLNPSFPDQNVTVKVTGRKNLFNGDAEIDHAIFSMFSNKNHAGGARDIMTHVPPSNIFSDGDVLDDQLITKISFATNDSNATPTAIDPYKRSLGQVTTSPRLTQIPLRNVGDFRPIAAVDIELEGVDDAIAPIFSAFNQSAQALDPRDFRANDRSSPNHIVRLKAITDISELNLVDANDRGRWGASFDNNGQTHVVTHELPRLPLVSLAQMKGADTGLLHSSGSQHIGNSFGASVAPPDLKLIAAPSNGSFSSVLGQPIIDVSWAANEELWDRYFFSGLHYGGSLPAGISVYSSRDQAINAIKDATQLSPFFNPRIRYYPSRARTETQKNADLRDYRWIARHLQIHGAFNVNSTSVSAWKAILGGIRGVSAPMLNGSNLSYPNPTEGAHLLSKFALQNQPNGPWTQPRSLDDDQINRLAEEIVKQVKARGPFMGMADFVNRRITTARVDGYEIGKLGALQMAIEAAGINSRTRLGYGRDITHPDFINKSVGIGAQTFTRSTAEGAPNYVMQADLLSSMGSQMTARSDTFTIRAYGECSDAAGNVLATAWCEARVVRGPDWLVPANEALAIVGRSDYATALNGDLLHRYWQQNGQFPAAHRRWGRKFEVQHFRWLRNTEV